MTKILIIGSVYNSPSQYYTHKKLISSLQDRGIKITFACESARNLERIAQEDGHSAGQFLRALKAFFCLLSHAEILNKECDYESFKEDLFLNIQLGGSPLGQGFLNINSQKKEEIAEKIKSFKEKHPLENALIKHLTGCKEIGFETIYKIFQPKFASADTNLIFKLLPLEQRFEICKLAHEKKIESFAMEPELTHDMERMVSLSKDELIKLEQARIQEMSRAVSELYEKAAKGSVKEVIITFNLGTGHSRRLQANLLESGIPEQDIKCLLLIGETQERKDLSDKERYFGEAQEIRCKALLDSSDFSVKPDKSTQEAIDSFVIEFVKSVKPEVKGVASRCVAMALAEKLPKLAEAIRNSR